MHILQEDCSIRQLRQTWRTLNQHIEDLHLRAPSIQGRYPVAQWSQEECVELCVWKRSQWRVSDHYLSMTE